MTTRLTPAEARKLFPGQVPKRHKYNVAVPTDREFGGVVYHSKAEARVAWELRCMALAGEIKDWTRQIDFPLVVNGEKLGSYRADFLVLHNDDSREIIEVKGMFTPASKLKWRLFLAFYKPSWDEKGWRITLRMV